MKICFSRLIREGVFFIASVLYSGFALANPVLGNVSSGQVTVQQSPTTTTVNQSSQKAIINWQSFNIGKSESTHFQQPAGGIALNRINPTQGASQIYGRLTATGQIILSNPAGVYFGPGSYVNVGGLIATTATMTDQDFNDGNYQFNKVPGYSGAVVNEGQIVAAQHGLVALVAPGVINRGVIQADLGKVVLASGDAFVVNFSGDGLYNFKISAAASSRGVDKDGNRLSTGVTNTGSLIANGGKILVTAQAAAGVLDNSIDMRGTAVAKSIYQQNGKIIISGDPHAGVTKVAANLDASAGETGTNGGFIETSGYAVDLAGIKVNVAGNNGGKNGTWLIDPIDLTICSSCTTTALSSGGVYGGLSNSTLLVTDLVTALGSGNVIVQTTSAGSGGNGDIFVNTPITWTSDNHLTLTAYRNVVINAGNAITNTTSSIAELNLIANNAGDFQVGSGDGIVTNNGSINVNGPVNIYYNPTNYASPIAYVNAGSGLVTAYMLINNASDLNDVAAAGMSDNYALSKDIDASSLVGFTSIGSTGTPFTGHFDGQSHKISYLTINQPAVTDVGLFGSIGAAGIVENVGVSGSVSGDANVGLLAGTNDGTITNAFSYGRVIANGNNVGGLVGVNSGAISDSYSIVSVSAATSSNVGGLVGDNSGTIDTSFSAGVVDGNSNVGGLVGSNTGAVNNSYWDTDTSGQASSAGGTGLTTADMMSQASYTGFDFSTIWGIMEGESYPYLLSFYPTAPPRVIKGQIAQFTGYYENPAWAPMADNLKNPLWTSLTPYALADQEVTLAADGTIVDRVYSNANGSYYFLEDGNTVQDFSTLLVYLSNGAYKSNTITTAPPFGLNITNLYLPVGYVFVTDNGYLTNTVIDPIFGRFIQISYLGSYTMADALGGLSGSDILYSITGFTPTIAYPSFDISIEPNYSFVTSPDLIFRMTGDLSTTNGSITIGPPAGFDVDGIKIPSTTLFPFDLSMDLSVGLTTNGAGNILIDHIYYPIPGETLSINSADNIVFYGWVLGINGNMVLNAAISPQSITTGSMATHRSFEIGNFYLEQGRFYSNYEAVLTESYFFAGGIIPVIQFYNTFVVGNEFTIDGGNLPSPKAEFIFAGGGDGSVASPYLIINYPGLQGIASSAYTLSQSYQLTADSIIHLTSDDRTNYFSMREISQVSTDNWNGGLGFAPIGNATTPFSGTFNGLYATGTGAPGSGTVTALGLLGLEDVTTSYVGPFIVINDPSRNDVGLFGVTAPGAVISNVNLSGIAVTGGDNVGALVGVNHGTIEHSTVNTSFIVGNDNVGALAGYNDGTINDASAYYNRLIGNAMVGGLVGNNAGMIDRAIVAQYIGGTSLVGGLVGVNTGILQNSFWDTDVTGVSNAVGSNTGVINNVTAGCYDGVCSNGGIVNLSKMNTFLGAGWDFTNTWWIIDGVSYPDLLPTTPEGGLPFIMAGKTSPASANQVLGVILGQLTYATGFFDLSLLVGVVTGADGSFYLVAPRDEGFVYIISAIGGNVTGSVAFSSPPVSASNPSGSITNIPLKLALNSDPSNSTFAFSNTVLYGLYAGYSLSEILAQLKQGNGFLLTWSYINQSYQVTSVAQQLYLGAINSVLYFQQNIHEDSLSILQIAMETDQNVADLIAKMRAEDLRIFKKYDITEIKASVCN